MSLRAKAIGISIALLGLFAILGGWFAEGYLEGVLLEVGASLLLVAPLFLVERILDARVANVREEVAVEVGRVRSDLAAAETRLEELDASVRRAVEDLEAQDDAAMSAFREGVSFETTRQVLLRARNVGAIESCGVRVQVPLMYARLRFRLSADDQEMVIGVESLGGIQMSEMTWTTEMSVESLFTRLAEMLQAEGAFPGLSYFNASEMLGALVDATSLVTKKKRRGSDLSPLVELPGPQWAVTTYGLECLEHFYRIAASRLDEPDLERHVSEKTWVDKDQLSDAWYLARKLHVETNPEWLVRIRDAEEA